MVLVVGFLSTLLALKIETFELIGAPFDKMMSDHFWYKSPFEVTLPVPFEVGNGVCVLLVDGNISASLEKDTF